MRIVLLALVLFLSACANKKEEQPTVPAHSKKVVVKLMDSLGMVILYIPERYDTMFSWVHDSDCSTCDHIKCRFQSRKNTVFMESGFFPMGMPYDSIDQLTIVYSPHLYDMKDGDTSWVHQENRQFRKRLIAEGVPVQHVLIDTCFTINDRPFAIMGTYDYIPPAEVTFYKLSAVTAVRGKAIAFEFNITRLKQDSLITNFVSHAIDIIKTITFSTSV